MSVYASQIEGVIRAVAIRSPTSFTWRARPSPRVSRRVERALTPRTARAFLVATLQGQLYQEFYCRGGIMTAEPAVPAMAPGRNTPFLEALSDANRGTGCWDDGWEVSAVENGHIVVHKDGLTVWAEHEHCRIAGACISGRAASGRLRSGAESRPRRAGAPAPGDRLAVRYPKEWPHVSPGFWMALGNESFPNTEAGGVVRVYWHLTAAVACAFVERATARLNEAGLPFRLKVASDPAQYTRCDAGVVYLPRPRYDAAAELLAGVCRSLRHGLRATVPAFTKQLAPGVGLAEDPGDGDSFGLNRCRLLAEGLVRAFEQRKRSTGQRMAAVLERFAEAGIAFDRPFLNPEGDDIYPGWPDDDVPG